MTVTFSDYLWFIIGILKVIIPYYVITNSTLNYLPKIIVISDVLYSLWIILADECNMSAIDINNINVLFIFNIFVSTFMACCLTIHALWNKKYLAVIWIVIPFSCGIMKGFSCALEDIINTHIK